jgi:hypothetical protein
VDLEDRFPAPHIRQIHSDLPVEASRTQQSRIENIRTVGGGNNDDAFLRIEPVHLHEQGIQCLLALVVATA